MTATKSRGGHAANALAKFEIRQENAEYFGHLKHKHALRAGSQPVLMTVRFSVPDEVVSEYLDQGSIKGISELQAATRARIATELPPAYEIWAKRVDVEARGRLDRALFDGHIKQRLITHVIKLDAPERFFEGAYQAWFKEFEREALVADLSQDLHFSTYPQLFSMARTMDRKFKFFVGPPNSGKTYTAFETLCSRRTGAYLSPLRLLALEGFEKITERGRTCSLVTGEERELTEGADFVSMTIEMLDSGTAVDCVVIDEAQTSFDQDRGWAWTQALAAAPATEVIVICSEFAVPFLTKVVAALGAKPEITRFERKQAVQLQTKPVSISKLQDGDAVIAFSRREVLELRDEIVRRTGKSVAVIYGPLSPEVRRLESARFASGQAPILVATDAIGMGLNLPIKRVVFSTLSKYDGETDRPLTASEFHQIGGRAGRYGMHDEGHVAVLEGVPGNLTALFRAPPVAPSDDLRAWVAPGTVHVQAIAEALSVDSLSEIFEVFVTELGVSDAVFKTAPLGERLSIASGLDWAAPRLQLLHRFAYSSAPVDMKNATHQDMFMAWAKAHGDGQQVPLPQMLHGKAVQVLGLEALEKNLKLVSLYAWLALRYPDVYPDLEQARSARREHNTLLEQRLLAKKIAPERRSR